MDKKRLIPDLWILALLFAGNLLIIGPFLLTDYSTQPWNNSYVYMAISRMFRDHKWSWNPLQYAGAPFHYLYPPVFHVLSAAVPFVSIGRAFHLVTAFGYALVPVCLYVLALQLFRSRLLAALVAIAYSLFPSPVFYFLPQWKNLAIPFANAPWGFVAIIGYEEAAHAFALSFTLLAVAAAWRNKWTLAALLAAIVFLTNWPALIGLGLALIALAIARVRDLGILPAGLRIFGTVGTAYGLSAFWMSPGYFVSSSLLNRVVIQHTNLISPWNRTTAIVLTASAVLVGISFWRRIPPACALVLAWMAVLGAVVISFSLAGNWLVPMPNRYMLEFTAGSFLAIAALISLFPRWRIALTAIACLAGFTASFTFITHAWKFQPARQAAQKLLSFQMASWLKQNAGGSRALSAGELDSTLALWSDVPQAGGTGQDVSNFLMFAAQRQVTFGCGTNSDKLAELWLRAMNVSYFVVHEGKSREYFHWFSEPEKFKGLPVAWDNGAGDKIYRIAGQHDAVIVDLAALRRMPPLRSTADTEFLNTYSAWAAGKRPAQLHWNADDEGSIDADLAAGEAVLVKVNHDRGWRVSTGTLQADPIGFLLIHGSPGRQHFNLRFGAAWDTWLGRAITLLTIVFLLARVPGWWIATSALIPAIAAYALLISQVPATAKIAEEAFARIQPPQISPGGIVQGPTNQPPPFNRGSIVSMYGLNLGTKTETPHVWLNNREAETVYHSPNMIVFKVPSDAAPLTEVSVEVNGCRGNAFAFETR